MTHNSNSRTNFNCEELIRSKIKHGTERNRSASISYIGGKKPFQNDSFKEQFCRIAPKNINCNQHDEERRNSQTSSYYDEDYSNFKQNVYAENLNCKFRTLRSNSIPSRVCNQYIDRDKKELIAHYERPNNYNRGREIHTKFYDMNEDFDDHSIMNKRKNYQNENGDIYYPGNYSKNDRNNFKRSNSYNHDYNAWHLNKKKTNHPGSTSYPPNINVFNKSKKFDEMLPTLQKEYYQNKRNFEKNQYFMGVDQIKLNNILLKIEESVYFGFQENQNEGFINKEKELMKMFTCCNKNFVSFDDFIHHKEVEHNENDSEPVNNNGLKKYYEGSQCKKIFKDDSNVWSMAKNLDSIPEYKEEFNPDLSYDLLYKRRYSHNLINYLISKILFCDRRTQEPTFKEVDDYVRNMDLHADNLHSIKHLNNNSGDRNAIQENEKPYRCHVPNCFKSYLSAFGLKYHMQSMHVEEEKKSKPYKCTVEGCPKRYKNSNGLKYHMEHHHFNDTGEKK